MCSGTSNYPWVTIWDIGTAYSGRSVAKSEKNPYLRSLGGGKKKNSQKVEKMIKKSPYKAIFWPFGPLGGKEGKMTSRSDFS